MPTQTVSTQEIVGLNNLLCDVFCKEVRLSSLLNEIGLSEPQVEAIKVHFLRQLVDLLNSTLKEFIYARKGADQIWYVLSERYGICGTPQKTYQKLSVELKISVEQVRELEGKGVRKLRLPRRRKIILERIQTGAGKWIGYVPSPKAIQVPAIINKNDEPKRVNPSPLPKMPPHDLALYLLHQMIGPDKDFRPGQWEAIETIAIKKQRALVVQRTGWGKSLVYFLATKLLREEGAGPTLLISPLLSLMRNQVEMAGRIGIRAYTINSANRDEWVQVEDALSNDECDLILISPERLNNEHFLQQVLPQISGRISLFVVDEAHCISDWGHDFRPDYRRIVRIVQMLPPGVPVLGTTATANNRVVADVQSQLGPGLLVLRGSLARESLRLQNIRLANQSERLAWIAETLKQKYFEDKSGIIYCLTVADTERVAGWLQQRGFKAEAYHAGDDLSTDRPALEQAFINNEIKILVATVALGMGFDKPDIDFVIHFQRPGSVVAYYQQVGRAGRAVDKSYGILLSGVEDDDILNYFIESAFPPIPVFENILKTLENSEGMSVSEILAHVNTSRSMAEKALKLLEVDGAVGQTFDKTVLYFRTPNRWVPDVERINRVLDLRRTELAQMQDYMDYSGCLMQFLLRALDDPHPIPCGRCANCKQKGLSTTVLQPLVIEAERFLKGCQVFISPRKRWPVGLFPELKATIPHEWQNETGRSLCYYGDSGWGKLVRSGKYQHGHFDDELVDASAQMIQEVWQPDPFPTWVAAIPSNRHPALVPDFAARLAQKLSIPFLPVFHKAGEAPEQKTMQNSTMQARNVSGTLAINPPIPEGPVLLVDDIIDSGWTLTMAGYLLRSSGSGPVYPFTLAQATGRNGSR
jgi:ATP-dependent DNA helicase RecQ